MEGRYDYVVAGGGPAGATFAMLAGRCGRTLLVDDKPERRVEGDVAPGKCCGGLIAPDAQRALACLGLGLPMSVLEEPQLFVVRAIDRDNALDGAYQRHYLNVDRFASTVGSWAWLPRARRSSRPPACSRRKPCGAEGSA